MRGSRLVVLAIVSCAAAAVVATASARPTAPPTTAVTYDDFGEGYTLADYEAKWSNPYGVGDMGVAPGDTRSFADGTFYIDDAPFRTSFDFSVFDHLKYIGTSNQSFAVPARGSLMFSSEISALTPGTAAGRVVH